MSGATPVSASPVRRRLAALAWILTAFLLISGCGGGGGGGAKDTTAPVIAVTSHRDGENIGGSDRSIAVSGTLEDKSGIEAVAAIHDGTVVAAAFDDESFSFAIALSDRGNEIAIAATDPSGNLTAIALALNFPYATFTTDQAASVVIGQPDFTSVSINQGGLDTPADNTLYAPWGNPAVIDGALYVPDTNNSRVLVYDPIPTANDASAVLVLGQADFVTVTTGGTAGKFARPHSISSAGGKLVVPDSIYDQVQIWNSLPTSNGAAADVVVGQPDFGAASGGCAQNRTAAPEGAVLVGGKLLVADTNNSRVLIWNSIPTTNGAAANLVLGQQNFVFCTENDTDGDGTTNSPAANTMRTPSSVWSDGTRVVVADSFNNRVLVWDSFPTANGQPADRVLGQPDMATTAAGSTQAKVSSPYNAASNGNQVFVADSGNNRVMVWNRWPNANGADADAVLVEPTSGFNQPYGVHFSGTQLFVGDRLNSRVLIFNGQ